jgi:hypothetical protein
MVALSGFYDGPLLGKSTIAGKWMAWHHVGHDIACLP